MTNHTRDPRTTGGSRTPPRSTHGDDHLSRLLRPGAVVAVTRRNPRPEGTTCYLGEVVAPSPTHVRIRVLAEERGGRWRPTVRPAPVRSMPWGSISDVRFWLSPAGVISSPGWRAMSATQPAVLDECEVAARLAGVATSRLVAIAGPLAALRRDHPERQLRAARFIALGVELDDVLAEVRRRQATEQQSAVRQDR